MIIYRTADGQPGYHQTDEMDEAIKYVERLRNGEGVDGARIFRLEEVNFDFRPYFKVEIGPSDNPIPADEVHAAAAARPLDPEPTANGHQEADFGSPPAPPAPPPAPPSPVSAPPADDVWTEHDPDQIEPTPLVEQANAFMPDEAQESELPARGAEEPDPDDGRGARRGLFGR